ncbi:MAG: SDR family oxidoreductase, partial [Planctomycetota bacterium]|nr:SDR family oxidoreductase [Planctomycetota bacterium]
LRADGVLNGGTIVNISSISSFAVSVNRGDYCLTKSALSTMTKLFAVRMAEHDVYVYEVSPGVIRSDMTAPVQAKYDALIEDGLSPIRRWGEPSDVAQAVSSLVARAFPFCTGQCLNIDGGFHIRRL